MIFHEENLTTIEELLNNLSSQDPETRHTAVKRLGQHGNPAAVESLLPLLEDPHDFVRRQTIYTLGLLQNQQATKLLLALLNDENPSIRGLVAEALGRIGGANVFEALVAVLETAENNADQIILALGQLGDVRAIPRLLDLFKDTTYSWAAARALMNFKDNNQVMEALIAALADTTPRIRLYAASAIRTAQIDDNRVVDPLLGLLSDDNVAVRKAAVAALGYSADARVVAPLIAVLGDATQDAAVRTCAAQSLGRIGDQRAVEPLIQTVESGCGTPAVFGANALGKIGDQRAVEPLLKAVAGEFGPQVRPFAAGAIGKLGDNRAFAPLITALSDADVAVRIAAADGLGYLGNAQALPALENAFENDTDVDHVAGTAVQDAAEEAILRIKQGHVPWSFHRQLSSN